VKTITHEIRKKWTEDKDKVVPIQKVYEGVEVYLHAVLTLALYRDKQSAQYPGHFPVPHPTNQDNSLQYPMNRRLRVLRPVRTLRTKNTATVS